VSKWTGTTAFGSCGMNITISIHCMNATLIWQIDLSWSNGCNAPVTNHIASGFSCSPINISFTNIAPGGACCNGTAQFLSVTVTK
jgi:hypothetical protein